VPKEKKIPAKTRRMERISKVIKEKWDLLSEKQKAEYQTKHENISETYSKNIDVLLELAARPEIKERNLKAEALLTALRENGWKIHPAKRALLGE